MYIYLPTYWKVNNPVSKTILLFISYLLTGNDLPKAQLRCSVGILLTLVPITYNPLVTYRSGASFEGVATAFAPPKKFKSRKFFVPQCQNIINLVNFSLNNSRVFIDFELIDV